MDGKESKLVWAFEGRCPAWSFWSHELAGTLNVVDSG